MKKTQIRGLGLFLAAAMAFAGLSACQKQTANPGAASGSQASSESQKASEPKPSAAASTTRTFKDSAGREVTLPAKINKIAPSGPLAQLVLYTAFPDKLCGVARHFGKAQEQFIPKKYMELPEFGQFYGKNTTLNMEAVLKASPDVIVDIGEAKKTIKEDMDNLQKKLNIPTVFIEANLQDMPGAYHKLAEFCGEKGDTDQLAAYCEKAINMAKENAAKLTPETKKSVYWAMGDKGLNTNAEKSFQSEVLQLVGADNVAKVEAVSRGGGTEVSFEQLLNWKPAYVLADSQQTAGMIAKNDSWQSFLQSAGSKVVVVPDIPYGVLSNPPSVNRVLGVYWLGQLLYPEQYKVDLKQEFKTFYKLFYHTDLDEKTLDSLLAS